MGRPAPMWLQRAYEVLADGRWHLRDEVLREMVKTVPPGVAYRRGTMIAWHADAISRDEAIARGARAICRLALNSSKNVIEKSDDQGRVLLRSALAPDQPLPLVLDIVDDRSEATHVLVPIEAFRNTSQGVTYVKKA